MSAALRFSAAAYQNQYLPDGGSRMDVVVRVASDGDGRQAPPPNPEAEFIILLDCSGSMSDPQTKLSEARRAAVAALMALRDGVAFAVIAGNERARVVYPLEPRLVIASEETRAAAAAAALRLHSGGGTAIGRWLSLAEQLFTTRDGVVRHAILLTDGKNQHETPTELDRALDQCRNRFRCECRAIGAGGGDAGWSATELLRIAQALSGTVQMVEDPSDLPGNFSQAAAAAMEYVISDMRLRIRVAEGTSIRFVKQVHPTISDLTSHGVDVDTRARAYSTGAWGVEQRDYHVAFAIEPRLPGTELRVAWIAVTTGLDGETSGEPESVELPVWACWTRDARESTRITPQVGHYLGQAELAAAIQDGVDAFKQQQLEVAQETLGRAVALAHRSRLAEQLTQLAMLVDVHDPERGLVSLRTDVDPTDIESAILDSVRTTGFDSDRAAEPPAFPSAASGQVCPRCQTPAVYRYCEVDGHDFLGDDTIEPRT